MDQSQGIVVAADEKAEWLLEWWWGNYSKYNHYPVQFVDFGMSQEKKEWCIQHGTLVLPIPLQSKVASKGELLIDTIVSWESAYKGDLWNARSAWFQKPLACISSCFEMTVWMDLDCEVCASLEPLFNEWESGIELAIVKDAWIDQYSSGVMLFMKNAPFLNRWAHLCATANDRFMGDQNALTELIKSGQVSIKELNPVYNWIMSQGLCFEVRIAHWCAEWGKEYIRKYKGLHALVENIEREFLEKERKRPH